MRNRGLKNRFDRNELRAVWCFHYTCLWCGKSGADCFHHIISPSSPSYQEGDFNTSILNACPLHNHDCHLYNGELHNKETEKKLLNKVADCLIGEGYALKEKDLTFLSVYSHLY